MRALIARGTAARTYTDDEIEAFLTTPQGQGIAAMMSKAAVGTPAEVREGLEAFAEEARADELITVHPSLDPEARVRSVTLAGAAMR